MKEKLIAILRLFGYFTTFLTVTIILMGVTKRLIFDWEASGPRLEMFGESLLTALGIAVTGWLIFGISQSREVFCGWPGWRDGLTVLGWALLSNHSHLAVRRSAIPLSRSMQRLQGGFAVDIASGN